MCVLSSEHEKSYANVGHTATQAAMVVDCRARDDDSDVHPGCDTTCGSTWLSQVALCTQQPLTGPLSCSDQSVAALCVLIAWGPSSASCIRLGLLHHAGSTDGSYGHGDFRCHVLADLLHIVCLYLVLCTLQHHGLSTHRCPESRDAGFIFCFCKNK